MEAKKFGKFIAEIRKERKMTQADLAAEIHVTDKAVSRWERGLGFPDIQTIEPLAQALGISVLELMRSEQQEQNELQYTKEEVAEILQSAGDIFSHQRQWEKNANLIAVIFGMGIAIAAWAAGIASLGGGLILGGLVGTLAVSLWYLFQNMEDGESRKIYGTAAFLSGGILLSLVGYVYGDRLAELLALDAEVPQQIYWTLWYLFLLLIVGKALFKGIYQRIDNKEKRYRIAGYAAVMLAVMIFVLWSYHGIAIKRERMYGIWNSAMQYAEMLVKEEKGITDDWLIGEESRQEGSGTYHITFTYYANAEDVAAKRESTCEYVIKFDATEGFLVTSGNE